MEIRLANAFASTFAFAQFYFFMELTKAKELASKRTQTDNASRQKKICSVQILQYNDTDRRATANNQVFVAFEKRTMNALLH